MPNKSMTNDELKTFHVYVNGTEQERLDYERRWLDNPGEGYEHKRVYQEWSPAEARHHSQTAVQCLSDHGHRDMNQMTRMSCGACALNGYEPKPRGWGDGYKVKRDGPNYAGWARIYVEAGRSIPAFWREAFANSGKDNRPYYDALGRSLVTFGVNFMKD